MTRIENDCVGCATETYPCLGSSCPYTNVEHHYCDKCGDEAPLYEFKVMSFARNVLWKF